MSKLFIWSVNHIVRNRNGVEIKRVEKGLARANSSEEARKVLEKSVCTIFSRDLIVIEIPDKMSVYSLGYTDSIVNS